MTTETTQETPPVAVTPAMLTEALDHFYLTVRGGSRQHNGQVDNPAEVASALHATLSRIAAERAPDADEITEAAAPLPMFQLPPPVADFGPVRLELMGHRYRQGHLSEVVIAGQPFLRLDLEGGAIEYYRPDAVYCITPGIIPPAPPRTAITSRFADDAWGDDGDDFGDDEDQP